MGVIPAVSAIIRRDPVMRVFVLFLRGRKMFRSMEEAKKGLGVGVYGS